MHLKEAVVAHRLALKEWTRNRVPHDWATLQNNLGNTLAILDSYEQERGRLKNAIAAYRSALEEWTRDRVPLDWAKAQNNLGKVLSKLGRRERGTRRLEQASDAYRLALEEWTQDRVPLDWATAFANQGCTMRIIAERRADQALAYQALFQISEALKVFQASNHPISSFYEDELAKAGLLVLTLRGVAQSRR